MNRKYVETFLGKLVKIKLFDGTVMKGYLHKTGTEKFKNNPNLYIPKNYYVLLNAHDQDIYNVIFRSSHIRKIEHSSALVDRIKSI